MKVVITKVFSDDSEVLYFNGDLVFDVDDEIDANIVFKKLIGYHVHDFKIKYISSENLKTHYDNKYPDDLQDFKYSHLT